MPETYFIASGDGPAFEPVSIQIVRSVSFVIPNSEGMQTVLVKTDREIARKAFAGNTVGRYSYFILTNSNPAVDLLALRELPVSAGLNPYRGSVENLIRTGEVVVSEVGSPVKIDIYRTEKEALTTYKQLGG